MRDAKYPRELTCFDQIMSFWPAVRLTVMIISSLFELKKGIDPFDTDVVFLCSYCISYVIHLSYLFGCSSLLSIISTFFAVSYSYKL